MKVTNKYNIPHNIALAMTPKEWTPDPQRIGVTDLIDGPLPRTLRIKHYDNLVIDVSDGFYSFLGTMTDALVKKCAGPWDLVRVKLEYESEYGLTLVGKPDWINVLDKKLVDLKYTSVWSSLRGEKDEWIKQVNVYDWLVRKITGGRIEIGALEIHVIMRDWVTTKAGQGDYPKMPVKVFKIDRWSEKEQEDFIMSRLEDHVNNPMRECTPDEKWQTANSYAVMKKGQKRAVRVLSSEAEALQYMKERKLSNKTYSIEKRPGACRKCEQYCAVKEFCPFVDF